MFKRLFGSHKPDGLDVHMPEVDQLPDIETLFAKARKAAGGEGEQPPGASGRNVIIVTPGRLLMFHPCPPAGSMPQSQVASIEQIISSRVKRNIAVIAYTELRALQADIAKAIPFLGILMGMAYIGHSVWVFEGHSSSLAAGCRNADLLLVDGGMAGYLQEDWVAVASGVMRNKEIYVH